MNAGLAYYNEHDPFAAAWLRELIAAGEIAPGVVDERSIVNVRPADLVGFDQCHFFAGIGGWSLALRLAGWPDDRPVWTGSCPCQPWSSAGKGGGADDERHLWPAFFDLIRACRPGVILGEQVASSAVVGGAGKPAKQRSRKSAAPAWIDLVFADLETAHYACGAADLPACGVSAPHIRQRLWWVGVANAECGERGSGRLQRSGVLGSPDGEQAPSTEFAGDRLPRVLADRLGPRLERRDARSLGHEREASERGRAAGRMGLADSDGWEQRRPATTSARYGRPAFATSRAPWSDLEWLPCRDGKTRPTRPGLFPLAAGLPAHLDRLCALEGGAWERLVTYGDANNIHASEAMRMVRAVIREKTHGEAAGGPWSVLSAPLLFDFLLCVEAACDGAANGDGVSTARTEARRRIVRGMRDNGSAGGSSCGRQSDEQRSPEPSDALLALSFVLARDAETYREVARQAHAASVRVGLLRGAGNAIVPQAGAVWIEAVMSAIPALSLEPSP